MIINTHKHTSKRPSTNDHNNELKTKVIEHRNRDKRTDTSEITSMSRRLSNEGLSNTINNNENNSQSNNNTNNNSTTERMKELLFILFAMCHSWVILLFPPQVDFPFKSDSSMQRFYVGFYPFIKLICLGVICGICFMLIKSLISIKVKGMLFLLILR